MTDTNASNARTCAFSFGAASVRNTVVGSGYAGLVAAVCLAEMGHEVLCLGNGADKFKALDTLID